MDETDGELAVSEEDREIKVRDKRMFTPEGELREEYREVEEEVRAAGAGPEPPAEEAAEGRDGEARRAATPDPSSPPSGVVGGDRPPTGEEGGGEVGAGAGRDSTPFEIPTSGPGAKVSFFDLAAVLAEPVPLYLGDAELPGGKSAENLDMARIHIDLLDVLRQKTQGNLSSQESGFLEDLLYRLRMRYVKKRG